MRRFWRWLTGEPPDPPQCCVEGCSRLAARFICTQHWKAMPLVLRQRWWQETKYSSVPPTAELVAEVNRAVIK